MTQQRCVAIRSHLKINIDFLHRNLDEAEEWCTLGPPNPQRAFSACF